MFHRCIIVIVACYTEAVKISFNAEVTFDIKFSNLELPIYKYRSGLGESTKNETEVTNKINVLTTAKDNNNMTAAPIVECMYQYPEATQVEAILSNMMNELTKVYTHARDLVEKQVVQRSQNKRFKVMSKKNTTFFESIFSNMTQDFNAYYNSSEQPMKRSDRDPCLHQGEVKQIWRRLLEYSLDLYKRSALNCITEYLKTQNTTYEEDFKNKLTLYLKKQIGTVRNSQLNALCDHFQLCYNELL